MKTISGNYIATSTAPILAQTFIDRLIRYDCLPLACGGFYHLSGFLTM